MVYDGAERLTEYCQSRVGKHLLSVTVYDPDGFETVYVRPDLEAAFAELEVERQEFIDHAWNMHEALYEASEMDLPLGAPRAGVYSFEEGIVLQFPCSDDRGIFATFEPTVGSQLSGFLERCREQVYE